MKANVINIAGKSWQKYVQLILSFEQGHTLTHALTDTVQLHTLYCLFVKTSPRPFLDGGKHVVTSLNHAVMKHR